MKEIIAWNYGGDRCCGDCWDVLNLDPFTGRDPEGERAEPIMEGDTWWRPDVREAQELTCATCGRSLATYQVGEDDWFRAWTADKVLHLICERTEAAEEVTRLRAQVTAAQRLAEEFNRVLAEHVAAVEARDRAITGRRPSAVRSADARMCEADHAARVLLRDYGGSR